MNPTNKIIIDCNGEDNKALAEKLSRCEPGDEVEFTKVVAKLDEYQNGVAVLSIEEIPVSGAKAEVEEDDDEAPAPVTEPIPSGKEKAQTVAA